MEIVLTAVDRDLAEAWHNYCDDLPDVSVYHGSIFDVKCDAVVSPANSFGFMDGGIDLIYSHRFGWQVQERLQKLIRVKHHGELLIGCAEIVETDNAAIPYLIAAPTMRVPMILKETVHPYLAARAVLLLVKHSHFEDGYLKGEKLSDVIQTIAFPGLGTGVGQVSARACAHQVRVAIEEVLFEKSEFPKSWSEAQAEHQQLYTDEVRDLQRE
ncbi:MAG: macro domain-containing protein [Leptolyngbyaceae cyanobacterium bins.302]|nr:macro domain-containing protein [Leptolyngbyaceae cyanobacterium bins.302]